MPQSLAILSVFMALAATAVVLRLVTRFCVMRMAGWDDGLIVVSLLTNFVFFAFAVIEVHHGLGVPQASLTTYQVSRQLKALYFTIPFYNLTLTFTKISMLVLYLRIFQTPRYRVIVIASLVVVPVLGLWMVLSAFLFCIPVSDFWSPIDQGTGNCLPNAPVWFLNAALQIATDLWVVILPMPMLAVLKLPLRQKVAVVCVFALGIFVCVMSVVRLSALAVLVRNEDFSRYNANAAIWSSIEANVAIICCCLPVLRRLIMRFLPSSIRGSTSSQREREKPIYPAAVDGPGNTRNANVEDSVEDQGQGEHDLEEGQDRETGTRPGIETEDISELRLDSETV